VFLHSQADFQRTPSDLKTKENQILSDPFGNLLIIEAVWDHLGREQNKRQPTPKEKTKRNCKKACLR